MFFKSPSPESLSPVLCDQDTDIEIYMNEDKWLSTDVL